jgi:uncharacterized membrane protein
MKIAGFLLLLTGWGIVLAALALLAAGTARACFTFAGIAVEILGLALVIRSQPFRRVERE